MKNRNICIRVTDEQRRFIVDSAAVYNISITDYVLLSCYLHSPFRPVDDDTQIARATS